MKKELVYIVIDGVDIKDTVDLVMFLEGEG